MPIVKSKKKVKAPVAKKTAKTVVKAKGVPLAKLLRSTPNETTIDAAAVKIIDKKAGMSKHGIPTYGFITKSPKPTTQHKPPRHKTLVRLIPGTKDRLWVRCSCEDFTFRWEYALTQNGASNIKYSNGAAAVVTNPNNVPGVCKHLYKILSRRSTLRTLQSLDK